MYSEHLNNVHPGRVVGGWLFAVAVASAVSVVMISVGVMEPDSATEGISVSLAVAVGFFAGGLFVGIRWMDAPILHGAGMTFVSVLVWFLGNVMMPGRLDGSDLGLDAPAPVLGLLLIQFVAAAVGGRMGRRWMLRGANETEG